MRDDGSSSREVQEALVRALARTADARRGQGRYADAERLYQRALALAEETFDSPHLEIAAILDNMALLKEAEGKTSEAEPLHRRASRMREAIIVSPARAPSVPRTS